MSNIIEETTKSIVGISIKTSNNVAAETIPALWGKYFGDAVAGSIPDKISNDIYAVYTGFENEGVNNDGEYTFLIGVEVSSSNNVENGLDVVIIPQGNYHKFDVPENSAEHVFSTWVSIWSKQDIGKTFVCDFELYSAAGDISINVGTSQSD